MKNKNLNVKFNIFSWSRRDNTLILRDYKPEEMTKTQHTNKRATLSARVYLKDKYLRLDQTFAYQFTGSTVTPLLWQPNFFNMGNGDFKFANIGTYDPNQTMVFQLGGGMTLSASVNTPQWCTYYGSDSEDLANDVKTSDNLTYMAGQTQSTNIPAGNGQSTVSTNGSGDGYVTCFESDYSIKWATVVGGSYTDGLEDIVLKVDSDDTLRLYAIGSTSGDGLPTTNDGFVHVQKVFLYTQELNSINDASSWSVT
jgi:hypothetical protein